MNVSVVIPARNVAASIGRLLMALNEQEGVGGAIECLVVDDGSDDGTADAAERAPFRWELRVLRNPVNQGRGAARNRGWRAARGDLIVFLDGDMLPEPGLIRDYERAFRSAQLDVLSGTRLNLVAAEPAAGAASRSPGFEGYASRARPGQYPSPRSAELELAVRELFRIGHTSALSAFALITSNSAVRRAALAELDGFDPSLRRFEDTELGLRLWAAGAGFGCVDGARAIHFYTSGGADRGLGLAELQGMFYRHPNAAVVATYLWLTHQLDAPEPQSSEPGPLRFARDPALAESLVARFRACFPGALPARFVEPIERVSSSLGGSIGWAVEHCARVLEGAHAGGLYAEAAPHGPSYDMQLSQQWLCTRGPLWQRVRELEPRLAEQRALLDSARAGSPLRLKCALDCEVWLSPSPAGEGHAACELDLPCGGDLVEGFVLIASEPALASLEPAAGTAHLSLPRASGRATLRCEATLRHGPGRPGKPPPTPADVVLDGWAEKLLRRLDAGLVRAGVGTSGLARARARRLYDWIIENTLPFDAPGPASSIVDMGMGGPSRQALLFATSCRRAGIPARLRRALLLSYRCGADGVPTRELWTGGPDIPGPAHAWAQFHDGAGWVDVDFIGALIGRRHPARHGTGSRELEDFYFGHLDPFRLPLGRAVSLGAEAKRDGAEPAVRALDPGSHAVQCRWVVRLLEGP